MPTTIVDMTPAGFTLVTTRGDTLQLTLSFYSDEAHEVPIDLSTASTIKMDVRSVNVDGAVVLSLEIGSGITLAGADNEQLIISSNTNLGAGKYVADVDVVFPGPITRTYVKINWTIDNDVTRDA